MQKTKRRDFLKATASTALAQLVSEVQGAGNGDKCPGPAKSLFDPGGHI